MLTGIGISRRRVIVGDIIARKLSCRFDIIIPRKLHAPYNEELAIGAVMEGSTTTYLILVI
jgi:putative phosphoribosyl transferase